MTHSYTISGMEGPHDARTIKKTLEGIEGIRSVEVTLEPPGVRVTMDEHIPEAVLNEALLKTGDYRLGRAMEEHEHHHSSHPATPERTAHSPHSHTHPGGLGNKGHDGGGPGGHDHHRMMIADFRRRFWISLVLAVPILLLSPMIQHWLAVDWQFDGSGYLLFILSAMVFFYGGKPFLTGFFEEIKSRTPGMMTLIAMAISVAFFYSAATSFGLRGESFYWELATLIVIMLLGHWIEMKSVLGASKALELLVSMMPAEAHKLEGDTVVDISLENLMAGDIILVKPGEKVPADGVVIEGESYLNESMLTGESRPVKKQRDQKVIGGSLNGTGSLKMKVEHAGKDSYLNKVISMVQEAQQAKSKMQNLSNKAAMWLTYIALTAGFASLFIWLWLGYDFVFALERMVTVMVISCPHALGLAVPLVVAISTALSAQNGLLIRNRTAFEQSRKITALVFDKTGTLTQGDFGVTRYESLQNEPGKEEVLRLAAALEQASEHPIAVGIVRKAKDLSLEIPRAEHFEAITGKGVQAQVEGKAVKVVSPGYLREKNIHIPRGAYDRAAETVVFVLVNEKPAGFIALADAMRPESARAIRTFKDNRIKVFMATGDNEKVARAVSEELKLDGYYAEILPHQKVEIVRDLQASGEFVAMTGDGVNDAPALAQADIGIAIGSGTDVAAETADIILVNSNPEDIANLILFGKATYAKMIQNLVWATGYNAIAIPLAMGVLYFSDFVLNPALGAVLMSVSTVIVAVNAQLLRRKLKKNTSFPGTR